MEDVDLVWVAFEDSVAEMVETACDRMSTRSEPRVYTDLLFLELGIRGGI